MSLNKKRLAQNKRSEDIDCEVELKIYYDTQTKKPCGAGFSVIVAGLDEQLPPPTSNRGVLPAHIEERFVVLSIFKKGKKL